MPAPGLVAIHRSLEALFLYHSPNMVTLLGESSLVETVFKSVYCDAPCSPPECRPLMFRVCKAEAGRQRSSAGRSHRGGAGGRGRGGAHRVGGRGGSTADPCGDPGAVRTSGCLLACAICGIRAELSASSIVCWVSMLTPAISKLHWGCLQWCDK